MPVKKLIAVVAFIGILGVVGTAFAQDDGGTSDTSTKSEKSTKPKTLLDRLDAFGKSIFGDIVPAKKKAKGTSPSAKDDGSTWRESVEAESPDDGSRAGSILAKSSRSDKRLPVAANPGKGDGPIFAETKIGTAPAEAAQPSADVTPENAEAESPRSADASPKPAQRPMHERLEGFRHSVFAVTDEHEQSAPKVRAAVEPARSPTTDKEKEPIRETAKAPAADGSASQSPSPVAQGNDVLFLRKGALLGVETLGPRTIAVGRESMYQVQLSNSGQVAAEEVTVYVSLPEWAEVAGVEASLGEAKPPEASERPCALRWKVGHLGAKASERLTLKIIPRQSRPFDLAVRWESKPSVSQTVIDVQEAKLSLQLEGPREVPYGKKENYRLKLTNAGNGNAENVVVTMTPLGAGENMSASHRVGLLAAGKTKTLDVELSARQAGNLTIRAAARADGDVHAELAEKVYVHRADLKVAIDGPKVQYVGAAAAYAVRVRNVGSAPARNIHLSIRLPAGVKYLSGIDGARFDPAANKLEWDMATLNVGTEQTFTARCSLTAAGMSRIRLGVAADDDLAASAETVVQIEAVANLTMDVKDPSGPIQVGDEAVYEVRVRNRGTLEARDVEVVAYFSRGIEPVAAEGAENRLGEGEVVFQPIASLAPGAEMVLKVHAKAEAAGNHVFRAETHCKPLGARLVSEATNLYYTDKAAALQASRTAAPAGAPPVQTQEPAKEP
jgi:uncharacterized repeat protein (TIGR01451 family)